jgi:hypothetical protein
VEVDVQECREEPQVGCDRRLEREQGDDAPLDIQVEPVHHIVASDYVVAESHVAVRESLQRLLQ